MSEFKKQLQETTENSKKETSTNSKDSESEDSEFDLEEVEKEVKELINENLFNLIYTSNFSIETKLYFIIYYELTFYLEEANKKIIN